VLKIKYNFTQNFESLWVHYFTHVIESKYSGSFCSDLNKVKNAQWRFSFHKIIASRNIT
jgi:hypothetical protein